MKRLLNIRLNSETAQSMVEYALIIVLVALFLVAIFSLLSGSFFNVIDQDLIPAI
jgi:Flp pilus assembly pilin Flp